MFFYFCILFIPWSHFLCFSHPGSSFPQERLMAVTWRSWRAWCGPHVMASQTDRSTSSSSCHAQWGPLPGPSIAPPLSNSRHYTWVLLLPPEMSPWWVLLLCPVEYLIIKTGTQTCQNTELSPSINILLCCVAVSMWKGLMQEGNSLIFSPTVPCHGYLT